MHKFSSQQKPAKSNIVKWGVIAVGILLILGLLLFVLEQKDVINLIGSKNSATQGPSKEESEQATKTAATSKQAYLDQTYKDGTTGSQPMSSTPTPATPSTAPATMVLASKLEGDTVTITTQIKNISSGNCKLTISNGAPTTSQTAQIIYQPEFSSCAGFSVAKSSLGTGTWNITVTATPDVGDATTQSTTLEVN